ncbi:MAG: PHB depolymerase family esterase, partial [Dokdonella sp.]
MNPRSDIDMVEVTRLTREGRLDLAMALLRGKRLEPAASPHAQADTAQHASRADADIVDMVPPSAETGDAWTAPVPKPAAAHAPAASARSVRKPRFRVGAGFTSVAAQSAVPLPAGARFDERNYADAAGARTYKLFVPASYTGVPLPLVVMLHGCTQSPDDFALGTRMNELAEEQGFVVAYPAQTTSANGSKCWNWFSAADQQRDRGEPALIAGITRAVMRDFAVDANRVYVAGLSAGGAMAAIMGATYPDLYAAVGVHSGLARGAASDMPSAFAAMRNGGRSPVPPRNASRTSVPTIVFHGDEDATVHPINGAHVAAQAKGAARLHGSVSEGVSAGGVAYTRTIDTDASGRAMLEQWVVHGGGHAWSGGSALGSYVEPRGPDASRAMLQFFRA